MLKKLVVVCLAMFIAGCAGSQKKDLKNYVDNELPKLQKLSKEALEGYKENNEDPAAIEKEVLPKIKELNEAAKKIEPKTDELKKEHQKLIDATEKYIEGIEGTLAGLKEEDPEKKVEKLVAAAKIIEEGQKIEKEWLDGVNALITKANKGG